MNEVVILEVGNSAGVGVTKAPFVSFSVTENFRLAKI